MSVRTEGASPLPRREVEIDLSISGEGTLTDGTAQSPASVARLNLRARRCVESRALPDLRESHSDLYRTVVGLRGNDGSVLEVQRTAYLCATPKCSVSPLAGASHFSLFARREVAKSCTHIGGTRASDPLRGCPALLGLVGGPSTGHPWPGDGRFGIHASPGYAGHTFIVGRQVLRCSAGPTAPKKPG